MNRKAISIPLAIRVLTLIVLVLCMAACNSKEQEIKGDLPSTLNPNGRNDKWGFVGPGGGGAMFNPAINPARHDHVFIACDMTGSYVSHDAGEKWRMFSLKGVTRFFRFHPGDPDLVFAGTSTRLFRSPDGGTSWYTIYPEPDNIVAIHTRGDHAQEVVVARDSVLSRLVDLVVDPDQPEHLYLLSERQEATGAAGAAMALIFSKNGGDTWEVLSSHTGDASQLFLDPFSPPGDRSIYLAGQNGILARRGGTWQSVQLPPCDGPVTGYAGGADAESGRFVLYAISGRSYFSPGGNAQYSGIFSTVDGGDSWQVLNNNLAGVDAALFPPTEFRNIAVCYQQPGHVYVSYAGLHLGEDSVAIGVAKSTDGGATWDLVWKDLYTPDGAVLAANRKSGWLDKRFGPGWGENPFHMVVAQDDPDLLYATDFGRTLKTVDGGGSWEQLYTREGEEGGWSSRGLQVTTGYMLAFDPFDSLHVFMANTDTGLMESEDGGRTWKSATEGNGVPRRWYNSTYWIVFDPQTKGKVWTTMSRNHDLPREKMWKRMPMSEYEGGVLLSNDSGKSWEVVSKDIGEAAITHLLMDPKSSPDSRVLYAAAFGKGVYKSEDGGLSWQQKNRGIQGPEPAAWRLTLGEKGELYLVVFRKSADGSIGNSLDGALYRSTDGAEQWTRVELPEGANGPSNLFIDPEDERRLILATWGRMSQDKLSPDTGGGIYISEDNGASWDPVLLEDQHIHDLTFDEATGTLYACGFNSSAYRSEDMGRTWDRIRGYNFKWGKSVQPDPYDPEKVYVITFGGGIWHGPAKGDEQALEDLVPWDQ